MANGFFESLQDIGTSTGQFARQKLAGQAAQQQREQKLADAIALAQAQEQAKAQFANQTLQQGLAQAQGQGLIAQSQQAQQPVIAQAEPGQLPLGGLQQQPQAPQQSPFMFDPIGQKLIKNPAFETTGTRQERSQRVKQESIKLSTGLRKEFTGSPQVKTFNEVDTQVRSLDSLLNQAESGNLKTVNALDQALITIFNKITDPGSVVRESEFARIPDNLPIMNRMQVAFRKFATGDVLTQQDRTDLVLAAKIIANERGVTFNREFDRFGGLAKDLGVKKSRVTGGVNRFKPFSLKTKSVNQSTIPTGNIKSIRLKTQ